MNINISRNIQIDQIQKKNIHPNLGLVNVPAGKYLVNIQYTYLFIGYLSTAHY